MSTVRKVQSKITLEPPVKEEKHKAEDGESREKPGLERKEGGRGKKFCHFCKTKSEPAFWDAVSLRRHLNDRGRIVTRGRSGTCAKHQRRVAREIKRARHLALLPYVVRI